MSASGFSRRGGALLVAVLLCAGPLAMGAEEAHEVNLPSGVKIVWNVAKAYRENTPTRERVCINGLWRWRPADDESSAVPNGGWGFFKVAGCWPGITDYMQKDSQAVHAHPDWQDVRLGALTAAWYEREVTVPAEWAGRRVSLQMEYVNSFAVVHVDGAKVGEVRFPAGRVDLTDICPPGTQHTLSILVLAMPLKGVMLSYSDTASAREVRGSVARRGLCGDVWLVAEPPAARVAGVRTRTSVGDSSITVDTELEGLAADARYLLRADVTDNATPVAQFVSRPFAAGEAPGGRFSFTEGWRPDKLWDTHTPQNVYDLQLSLLDADGNVLDTAHPVRFGFREFRIDGRDFYLNGTRIFLSSVPFDNAQVGAAWANYAAARESMERLQAFGVNFVYTHNYGCQPGAHLSFEEILRAADDTGMLVALSQPHFGHYDWDAEDADATNGYAEHARFYTRVAGSHPSVVAYSMSHNATGYSEDMNPDLIDGVYSERDTWSRRNAERAVRAEAIVKGLDPGRIVYHHSSGNLSSMHTSNFYANFVPVQEMSDWFEHWATEGVKPLFLVEYGVPFTWDWTMYRGWYDGKRAFGNAQAPWEFCLAEWNSQFLGDGAFRISEREKANLRWEAEQFRQGRIWHRWDYPTRVSSGLLAERDPVFASYFTDNWRAFRTWGVSAFGPWGYGQYWQLRDGVDKARVELATEWDKLQRPGLSPDYMDQRYERVDLAFERDDWQPSLAAAAFIRNSGPLLGYIAGKPERFTSKDHIFTPGETVRKQLVVINNSRETVTCRCEWSLGLPGETGGSESVELATGQQVRVPVRADLPADLAPGSYPLTATFRFAGGQVQEDAFSVDVIAPPAKPQAPGRIALFDPQGETAELLRGMGVEAEAVGAEADLAPYDVLVIGKGALTPEGAAPDVGRVREGLKVIVFEQTPQALEARLGFRTAAYGLRQAFRRVPDSPLLAGLTEEQLRDWRGEATILPPRLDYTLAPEFNGAPTVKWCGVPVTRAWRAGCRGNVASVLIEKPACGDFLPIVDGGFSLQYSPLLEYREGQGMVLFCQMDVTGRTEEEPAARTLAGSILDYVSAWQPIARRQVVHAGDPAAAAHLTRAGVAVAGGDAFALGADQLLVVTPGGAAELAGQRDAIGEWLAAGGRVLAFGLDGQAASMFLPFAVEATPAEHIAAYFAPPLASSPLAGLGPADVQCRAPRDLPLVTAGASPLGDGVLAVGGGGSVVFCQMAPWQFDYTGNYGLKRTFRRSAFLFSRLLANAGAAGTTPLLERFSDPAGAESGDDPQAGRWLEGLYLDKPEEWDDPYRFFRW